MAVTIETPLGPVKLWPSHPGKFIEDQKITSLTALLTVPRPGTKTRSLWDLQISVVISPTSPYRRDLSLYGGKRDGEGAMKWLNGSSSREQWRPVREAIKRDVIPLIEAWIEDNGAQLQVWQREHFERLAREADASAISREKAAETLRDEAAQWRAKAADL